MPARLVYFVDFAGGNLEPSTDDLSWGPMMTGGSGPQSSDPSGLVLSASGTSVENSIHVIPHLPVESRLVMSLCFDQPHAEPASGDGNHPEPWAVGLKVMKSVAPADIAGVPVTCQFNARGTKIGVRLNTPSALQTDNKLTATDLDLAPAYADLSAAPFELKFLFCGVQAVLHPGSHRTAVGYVVACGFLSVGTQTDQRVFSESSIWTTDGINPTPPSVAPSIGAIGAAVTMTKTSVGTISARLKTFSVHLWPPAIGTPSQP